MHQLNKEVEDVEKQIDRMRKKRRFAEEKMQKLEKDILEVKSVVPKNVERLESKFTVKFCLLVSS